MSPIAAQASASEDARDLASRPESDTTIRQYYNRSNNSSSTSKNSDPEAGGQTSQHGDRDLESHINEASYGTTERSRSNERARHRNSRGRLSERAPLLDPSDPAVSPLNIEGIRILRITLWSFLVISLIFTLALFVNTFVTLPTFFFRFRDSGFQELVLITIADFSLFLSICFFRYPTETDRFLGYTATVSLLIAFILTVAVPATRHRTTLGSAIILIWTLLSFALSLILTPAWVKWGKVHEEVRLTGRVETRKTFREWIAGTGSALLTFVLVVLPAISIFLSVLLDIYDYARLHQDLDVGTFVDIYPNPSFGGSKAHNDRDKLNSFEQTFGEEYQPANVISAKNSGHGDSGYRPPSDNDRDNGFSYSVYVYCTPRQGGPGKGHNDSPPSVRPSPNGKPAPIVLIEADSGTSAQQFYEGWVDELYNDNKIAQVCYWNRPGRGFSDNAPSPFSLGMAADALTAGLRQVLGTHNSAVDDSDDKYEHDNPFGNNTFAIVGHGVGGLYGRVFASRHIQHVHSLTLIDAFPEELLVRRLGKPTSGFKDWWKAVWSVFGFEKQVSWLIRLRGSRVRMLGKMAANTRPNELKASLQEQISALGIMRNDIETSNSILHGSDLPLAVLSSGTHVRADQEWSSYQRTLTKVTAKNVAWEVLEGPHDLWLTVKAKKKMQEVLINLLSQRDDSSNYLKVEES